MRPFRRRIDWLPFVVALLLVALLPAASRAQGSAAEPHVALAVGVSAYSHLSPLPNPANDARVMARTLAQAGFELVEGGPMIDPDRATLDRAIQGFARRMTPQTIGVFYFAGHGIQVRERNFLAPA